MKVFLDTNILISAVLNPGNVPFQAYLQAVTAPNRGVICDQNIYELRRVFNRKFPAKIPALERFLSYALTSLEIAPTPVIEDDNENNIRDVNDRPILRAALAANVDILITGDRDFIESGLQCPIIMTAAAFVKCADTGAP